MTLRRYLYVLLAIFVTSLTTSFAIHTALRAPLPAKHLPIPSTVELNSSLDVTSTRLLMSHATVTATLAMRVHTHGPKAVFTRGGIMAKKKLVAESKGLASIFAQRLRELRAEKGMNQETVAEKSKLSTSYISMLERGMRTPPLETIEAVAKALGVDPIALLTKKSA